MKLPKLDQVESKSHAISLAIDWQKWASEQSLSWGEVAEVQAYFEALAKKFNLTNEFKENGIL
jgi:hypothetical protein